MGNISVRLPEDIEAVLEHEARLSDRSRSELVREAITEYVARRARQRFLEQMVGAARALAADTDARGEALDIAEGSLADGLDTGEFEQVEGEAGNAEKWWR
jgi:predicted transcriptional regulator